MEIKPIKNVPRGDKYTIVIYAKGNFENRNNYFTVKEDDSLSSERIIDSEAQNIQITATYNSNTGLTKFEIYLLPEHTNHIDKRAYFYDIESVNPSDSTDITTPLKGPILFDLLIRNTSDGTTITTNKQTVTEVNASDFDENDMLQVQTVSGSKKFVGKNKTEVKQFLDIDKFLGFKTYAEIMAIDTSNFTGGEMVIKIDGTPTTLLWNKIERKWQ